MIGTFSGNQADASGKGIHNWEPLAVHHSTFFGNRADANGDGTGQGGAIRRNEKTVTLHHTLVAGNIRGLRTNTVPDDLFGTFDSASSFNLIADAGTSGGLQHGVNGNIVGDGDGGTIDAGTILNTTLAWDARSVPTTNWCWLTAR